MSRFNTGNPLGSNDPRDLDDNAKNMDLAVNSEESQWIDRFGRPRLPLMEQERQFQSAQESRSDRFNDFIISSGYQFAGDYGPGIEITEYNQLIRDSNGEFWRVSGQVDLPYTTTGAGIPEDDALVPAGDAVLRQEIRSGIRRAVSINDMAASPGRFPGDGVEIVGGGIPGTFRWVSDDLSASVADGNKQAFIPADGTTLASGGWIRLSGTIDAAVTIYVGEGRYFSTLNQALDFVSGWRMSGVGRVRVMLTSGFVMREQVVLDRGRDLSFVEITSEDAEVIVNGASITIPTPGGIILVDGSFQPFGPMLFAATEYARLPVIGALFRYDTSVTGGRGGVRAAYGGSAMIRRGCGVLDCPTEGLTAIHGGHIVAAGANFSGAGSNAVTSYRGSFVDFRDGIADNAGQRGAYVGSNSRLEALHASFKNAASHGIEAYGASVAHVRGASFEGAGGVGMFARDGAVISTRESNLDNVGQMGIRTLNGGQVFAELSTIRNSGGVAVSCSEGGIVNIQGGIIEGAGGHGLHANRGSRITAEGVSISGCTGDGIRAQKASQVNASASTISGCGGDGVRAESGSTVAVSSASTVSGMGGDLIYADGAGTSVDASRASLVGSGAGAQRVYAYNGATISIERAVTSGTNIGGLMAVSASTINADGTTLAGGQDGTVFATRASTINVNDSTVGEPATGDAIRVVRGSTICAINTGSATTSQTPNSLTINGVIYQGAESPEEEV